MRHSLKEMEDPTLTINNSLTSAERLKLQQLLQHDFWSRRGASKDLIERKFSGVNEDIPALPERWELTRGIDLHSWQQECVDAWFKAGKRGVLKVVTGAGKTILALAIAEKLQQIVAQDLRIAIVVPTVVLLAQWREEIAARSNLPPEAVGYLGAGSDDTFGADTRILICVLNSAARKLPELVLKAGVGATLLLVVDECHRAGSREMQRIFATERAFSLGLSATPERDTDQAEGEGDLTEPLEDESFNPATFDDSVLGRELGPVIFELNYADAINLGVLPPFRIVHYGLNLLPAENANYDRVSREITTLRQELERPGRRGLGLIRWCRSRAAANNLVAARLLALTVQRKRLLFQMAERTRATIKILADAFDENPATRAIIFHESIEQVMALFAVLRANGFPVVAEHSEFSDSVRAESLQLFRQGIAQIIVSARSLIEGFNVPSADLGIVVAASSSVRQRVQTLGRLLRKSHARDGSEKQASLYVLYAAGTVDELIYEKANWEEFVGAERNSYLLWSDVDHAVPIEASGPPRRPNLGELSVDAAALDVGGTYPGDPDEGREYTRDSQGTIRTGDGLLTEPHSELAVMLKGSRKAAGRFRITPIKRYVIELEKIGDNWRGVYLGTLSSPVHSVQPEQDLIERQNWQPGDQYPLSRVSGRSFSVLQRDPRLIAQKEHGKVRFVIPDSRVSDPEKRRALKHIQAFLGDAYRRGHRISKITVTKEGHVVYVFNNQAVFVGLAPDGAGGFVFESDSAF
jgi:superfamily II DNA or RNA helicase